MQNEIRLETKDELLTRREAATLLKVHTETIKRWQKNGRLPALVLGPTTVRYRRADIERFLSGSHFLAA
jgi:excisionase family DNA binding protein